MKTVFQKYPENPLKKHTRKITKKKSPILKTQEKNQTKNTNLGKSSKNTNSEILPKKHPNQETPIFENRGKNTQKKTPKKTPS